MLSVVVAVIVVVSLVRALVVVLAVVVEVLLVRCGCMRLLWLLHVSLPVHVWCIGC